MAISRISSVSFSKQILRSLCSRFVWPLSTSTAVSSVGFAEKQDSTTVLQPSIAVWEDVKGLFSSVPTGKLIRSFFTLKMVATEPVVDLGTWVMRSRLMKTALFRGMVVGVTKATFFDHFVAGKNHEEAGEIVKILWNDGLSGMLDYGLVHAYDNVSCDVKDGDKLQFAQLYGMSEAMSYELKNEGFQVRKYLPFGPAEQISLTL